MADPFEEPDDATPLTPDERKGLVPADITDRHELNRAEQQNITRAQDWALSGRRNVLTEKFVKDLHLRMLGDVWRWAGNFRTSERNMGIPYYDIPVALRQLLADAAVWIEHNRTLRVRRKCSQLGTAYLRVVCSFLQLCVLLAQCIVLLFQLLHTSYCGFTPSR